jgi:CRISPR-associated protein Csm3
MNKQVKGILGKIAFEGKVILLSGLHIGGSKSFSAIGAVDSSVIRNSYTREPYIPGSSIKGKMRYLLARVYAKSGFLGKLEDEDRAIQRLFGSSRKDNIVISRLQFADLYMNRENRDRIRSFNNDLYLTEVKFENTIDRYTAGANPRQIERVPAGAEFDFKLIYNIEDEADVAADLKNIGLMFTLLEQDYLGGHGTRGYGRVKFSDSLLPTVTYYSIDHRINQQQVEQYFSEGKQGVIS